MGQQVKGHLLIDQSAGWLLKIFNYWLLVSNPGTPKSSLYTPSSAYNWPNVSLHTSVILDIYVDSLARSAFNFGLGLKPTQRFSQA